MESINETKRWVCPSDRELMLRAKLNSGWSVHTHDTFRQPPPILAPELRCIEGVLERAKLTDLLEKERIEKLVCRLENMKRNAVGDGRKSCSMCAAGFGLFFNLPSNCADCLKAVCEKCRIDIRISTQEVCLLCKICAENREVWKKSGGWFYGAFPVVDNCPKAFNTWEHTKQDIVRLESFKPAEENYIDVSLYKNWATNSSPDLSSLDEDGATLKDGRRKHSDSSADEMELSLLSVPDASQLSHSCPALSQEAPPSPLRRAHPVKGRRKISYSRNRIFTKKQPIVQ